jgi:hypothetical protein
VPVRRRKFILSPKVKGRVLGICVLCDTLVMILLFAPLLKIILVNPIFSRYFRKLLLLLLLLLLLGKKIYRSEPSRAGPPPPLSVRPYGR